MKSYNQEGEVMRPSYTCGGHSIAVATCALNFDGSLALSADFLGVARLWSTSSGEEIAKFEGHDDAVLSCALSRSGEYAVTAGSDGSVCIWHTPTKSIRYRLRRPGRDISAGCAFSPDGTKIVASFVAGDRSDVGGDILICSLDSKHSTHIRGWTLTDLVPFQVACANDTVAMCVKSSSGRFSVLVMDPQTGKYQREWPTTGPAYLSLSEAGDILSIADDVSLAICPVSGKEDVKFFHGYRSYGAHHLCDLSADGTRLLSSCADNSIGAWDVATGVHLTQLSGHDNCPLACAISGDGAVALSCGLDSKLLVWSFESLRPKMQNCETSDVSSASFASDSALNNKRDIPSNTGDMVAASADECTATRLERNTATKQIGDRQSISRTRSSSRIAKARREEHKKTTNPSGVSARRCRFAKTSENANFWIRDCARAIFKLAVPRGKTLTHSLAAHEIRLLCSRIGFMNEVHESAIEEALEAADIDEDERLAEAEFETAVLLLSNSLKRKQEDWMFESCRLGFQLALPKNGNKKSDTLSYGEAIQEVSLFLINAGSPMIVAESELEVWFKRGDTNESDHVNEAAFLGVMKSVLGRIEADDESTKRVWESLFLNASGSRTEKIPPRQAARIIAKTLTRGSSDGTIKGRRDPVERSTVEECFTRHGCPDGASVDHGTFTAVAERLRRSLEGMV